MQEKFTQNSLKIDSKTSHLENYLHSIHENILRQNSNKTALIFKDQHISYAEVGKNVIRIVSALKKQKLNTGAVVAICLRKSPEHLYTVLACALIGMIWLPIDMDSPPSRLQYLLSNSHADIAVTDSPIAGIQNVSISDVLVAEIEYDTCFNYQINRQPAYYLYTSGSTGTPKCVVLNNQATANVLVQSIANWKITSDDIIMAITPSHHDMSVFDVFATLAVGATLLIPSVEQSKNAIAWATLVERYNVTIWSSVPAIVDMLLSVAATEQLQSLRVIAQGGDYIKPALIAKLRQLVPDARLFSLGGPTETTIWSIWHEISAADLDIIPYGKALEHNQYFILDENLAACQIGEVGTMYMTGLNLSNGYLLDGQIDTKDFVEIPIAANQSQIAFRMSDQGFFRADQNIIFSGRAEGYLKIKGVRISAAEVENALSHCPSIHNCVVVACMHPTTEIYELVAMYTRENHSETVELNIPQLKDFLRSYVPDSHIPSKYLIANRLPLTANGKLDRKAVQQIAQAQLYSACKSPHPTSSATHPTREPDVANSVLTVFRDFISANTQQRIEIYTRSAILELGIRPKQLLTIAETLSQTLDTQIDFYALITCKTIQDVVNKVQQQLNA